MNLLIVESPNKIRKLSSFLGPNWEVKASAGHIADLAIKKGIDGLGLENTTDFKPIYEIDSNKKSLVNTLKASARNKNVFIATDPDREGEAIAMHIRIFLNLKDNYQRVTFNEITSEAVNKAITNPRKINFDLVNAQETRRIIDRLYGFKGSNTAKAYSSDLRSVGRVQSAGLKIVIDREREIIAFKSRTYKEPQIKIGDVLFELKMNQEEIIKTDFTKLIWPKEVEITSIEQKEQLNNPPKPLTTAAALKVGSVVGFRPAETTTMLQKLFEQGFITYIRTDSCNVSDDFKNEAKKFIESRGQVSDVSRIYKLDENAQAGHEAIRPTHIDDEGKEIKDSNQRKLYEQIRKISISSQMESGIDVVQTATIIVNDLTFTNISKTIKKNGYRDEMGIPKGDYSFTKLDKGTSICEVILKDKKTSSPARYSETSFLSKIEKEGIGRPSTYATILQTIQSREYVHIKEKQLVPTPEGFKVIEFLEKHFSKFIELKFTEQMEKNLDLIANGKSSKIETLKAFNNELESYVTQAIKIHGTCPKCGSHLNKRKSAKGEFYGCSKYPECKYIKDGANSKGKASTLDRFEELTKSKGKKTSRKEKNGNI